LHHAACDQNFIGITPDYPLIVRNDILEEHDGPMLRAGLHEVHQAKLHVPSPIEFRPDRDRLSIRYELFAKAI
jgi:putative restriction endonuclease